MLLVLQAQAEKLGSGESTFNMLTARPKQQSAPEAPVLFDYTPPNQLEEEADPEESLPLATFERKRALEEATEQNTAKLESSAASVSAEHQREEMLLQGIQVSQPTLSQVRTPAVNPNAFRLSAPQADQLTAVRNSALPDQLWIIFKSKIFFSEHVATYKTP